MRLKLLTLATLLATSTGVMADEVLQQAESLLSGQKAADAVALLAPLEEERAGDPDYDYLLGQALLETGDPSNAVFAFERCLTAQPENGPCRVQMARTHLAMGETANARAELETIQAYNPPAQVQELVSKFLGAVSVREKQEKRQLGAFVQAGAGFDSNANSATNATQFAVPGNVWPLNAQNRSLESSFAGLQAGGSFIYRHTPKVNTSGDIGLNLRNFFDESQFSYHMLDGNLGTNYLLSGGQIGAKLALQKMWLDGNAYRDVVGLSSQYQRDIGLTGQLACFLQANRMRYDSQSDRDADRLTGGAAWSQGFDGSYSPVVYTSAYTGNEKTDGKGPNATQYANDFFGLRAGGTLSLSNRLRLNGSLSHESRSYDTPQVTAKIVRDDKQTDLNLGLAWRIKPTLTLQPAYTYTQNKSNIVIYDFDRHVISLDLRYDL